MARGYLIPQFYDSLASYRNKLTEAGFEIEEITEYVSDFRIQNKKWGDAYKMHYDAIVSEQDYLDMLPPMDQAERQQP